MDARRLAQLTLLRNVAPEADEVLYPAFSAIAKGLDSKSGHLLSDLSKEQLAELVENGVGFVPEGELIEKATPFSAVTRNADMQWGDDMLINPLSDAPGDRQLVVPARPPAEPKDLFAPRRIFAEGLHRPMPEAPSRPLTIEEKMQLAKEKMGEYANKADTLATEEDVILTPEQMDRIKQASSQAALAEMTTEEVEQQIALAALEEAKAKTKYADTADISPTDDKPLPDVNIKRSPKERINHFGEYFRPVYNYVGEHPLISIAGTGAAMGISAVALNQARQGEEQTFEEPIYQPTPVGAMPASFSPRWA